MGRRARHQFRCRARRPLEREPFFRNAGSRSLRQGATGQAGPADPRRRRRHRVPGRDRCARQPAATRMRISALGPHARLARLHPVGPYGRRSAHSARKRPARLAHLQFHPAFGDQQFRDRRRAGGACRQLARHPRPRPLHPDSRALRHAARPAARQVDGKDRGGGLAVSNMGAV